MKKMWIIPVALLALAVIWFGVVIGTALYRNAKRSAFQEEAGIMSRDESAVYDRLLKKYGVEPKISISREDFSEVITLIKKKPIHELSKDNYSSGLRIAALSSLLVAASLNEEQKSLSNH